MSDKSRPDQITNALTDLVNPLIESSRVLEQFLDSVNLTTAKWLQEQAALASSYAARLPLTSLVDQFYKLPYQTFIDQLEDSSIVKALAYLQSESIQDNIRQFNLAALAAERNLRLITDSLSFKFDFKGVLDQLPDLGSLIAQWQEVGEAQETLGQHGFGFTGHLWTTTFIVTFAKADTRTGAAAVTTRLRTATCAVDFEAELRGIVEGSSVLQRRWKIIAAALQMHRNRTYLVSIPALLAQLEGIIGDALILKGLAVSVGHKVYMKGADGRIKKGRDRKPVEMKGVGQLVQNSDFRNHEVLQLTVDLLLNQLVRERNAIMHGRMTAYGTAKRSTQLFLLLFVYASAIAEFESNLLR